MDIPGSIDLNSSGQAKLALAALLGSTMAQLKEIDKSIVGSSSNISSKLDVGKILQSIPQAQQTQQSQPAPLQIAANFESLPQLTHVPIPVQQQSQEPQEDPNQLIFDFNKPITPETINSKLDLILEKLNRILDSLSKNNN